MPKNQRSAKDTRPNVEARLAQLEQQVEAHQRELDVQLRRMAQIQADLDDIRGAWVKMKQRPPRPSIQGH